MSPTPVPSPPVPLPSAPAPRTSRWLQRVGRATASLEDHALVTNAMKRSPAELWWDEVLAEPLAVLSRSLDEQADLSASGRRAARRLLIDLLVSDRPPIGSAVGAARVLIVTGAPGVELSDAQQACGSRGFAELEPMVAIDGAEPLATIDSARFAASWFTSAAFEYRWHVPDFAEWMLSTIGQQHIVDLLALWVATAEARTSAVDGAPSNLRHVTAGVGYAESLPAILGKMTGACALIVQPTDAAANRDRFLDQVIAERARHSLRSRSDVDARYVEWRLGTISSALEGAASGGDSDRIHRVSSESTADELGAAIDELTRTWN